MTQALSDPELRRQLMARKALTFIVVIILAYWPLDWLSVGAGAWKTLPVRAAWAVTMFALISRFPEKTVEAFNRTTRLIVTSSVVYLIALAALTGGSSGLIFPFFPLLPLLALVFTQDDGNAVGDIFLGSMAGMTAILLLEGAAPLLFVRWLGLSVAMGVLALYGSRLYRQRRQAELTADNERISAIQALAQSERQRAQSEKLALVGQLSAGVAHEVNNPLAFVVANANYLEQVTDLSDPDARAAYADLKTGLQRIEQIVRDLKSFSRADEETSETVDAHTVADEAVRIAQLRVRGVARLEMELPPGLPAVSAPYGRVVQVLVNLIVNASDALQSSSPRPAEPRITLRAVVGDDERLRLHVEDNGPGIPPDALEKIFEPFFTTKGPGKGTGLGLPLSREYATRWGGALSAENRAEGGARFTVELPLAHDHAAASESALFAPM